MGERLKLAGGVGLGAGLLYVLGREGARRGWRDAAEGLSARTWSPAARLLAGAAGGGLAFYGARRRDGMGAALGGVGLGLIARGLSDRPLRQLVRLREIALPAQVRRAIHVAAPPAAVLALWMDSERLPQFLSRLRSVREVEDGRVVWEVEGPSGVPVEWDLVLSELQTERELSWRTAGDPDHAQTLRVECLPDAEGGTRIEVTLTCTPPETSDGQELVTLFGADPRRQLEQDLARMKRLLEAAGTAAASE
jgi:uncharacterized membrane protein